MFRLLGLQVRHMICTHRFNESPLPFPLPMQEMLRKNEIVDLHDYVQISVERRLDRHRCNLGTRAARVWLSSE